MSTKKAEPNFAPVNPPSLVDSTPAKTAGYFSGQLIMLTPEIDASSGYDKATYGTELDVTPHQTEYPGLQVLPSPANYNVPIPDPFPTSGTWKCPVPAVIQGIHGTIPPKWNASTSGGKRSLTFNVPPTLGGVPQPAGGALVLVSPTFLTGVSQKTPPAGGNGANQVRIQVPMQLESNGQAVAADSGPYVGFFMLDRNASLTLDNLAIYNKTGSGAPSPVPYQDGKQFWAQSDANGMFDLYIVPNDGTDTAGGWIELKYSAGLSVATTSLIIMPPKTGFEFDNDLGSPRILEEESGIVDPSSTSVYNVILPGDALSEIALGTDMFLLINGKQQPSTLTSTKGWMNSVTPIFTIDASNPDLITLDKTATLNSTNGNRLQYVVLDPVYGLLASTIYSFWAQKSSDQLAPPGPPNPNGDPGMSKPTIRELKGQVLSGADIVKAGSVHVDVSWQTGAWVLKNGQTLKAQIWLNGYKHGGLEVHQNVLTGSTPIGAATTSPQTITFDMEQFADYGPPHNDASQWPTMQVQYYIVDTDGHTVLRTSPSLTIYLDTIPAGE